MEDFLTHVPHNFKPEDVALIRRAHAFAMAAHQGQKRKSGEDYIIHPTQAAIILGHIFPDASTIAATVLHDVPEDTAMDLAKVKKEFGPEIAKLVDGVTKLGHVRLLGSKEDLYMENLRKMFIATSQDVRVILIKLADRLHNMRTIHHLAPEKQVKIATETLEMYAPIAGRLGIGAWKDELEDLSFEVVDRVHYNETKDMLEAELQNREKNIAAVQKQLAETLKQEGVLFTDISGRIKRLYSLYKKLQKYENDITKIYDIIAFRVITQSTADCYAALGIIHKHFQPVPGRVKDFIALPKPNGYQSIHTTVFDKFGKVFELQTRTDLMHEEAERGIAAHWFYSESGKRDNLKRMQQGWIQELHAWQEDGGNPEELLENLKIDLFHDRIFVLTPKGDVKDLPAGASVIDFAFSVHTDLGRFMMGAKINGKMGSIYDGLHQGDVVEIIKIKKPATMSRNWLEAAKTRHARAEIRHFIREHQQGFSERLRGMLGGS